MNSRLFRNPARKLVPMLLCAAPLALLAGCGESLPQGEEALREIIPAITGDGPQALPEETAVNFAQGTASFAGGFLGEEFMANWKGEAMAEKAKAAFKPHAATVEKAMYASIASALDENAIKELIGDVRDPKRMKAIKCGYKPDSDTFFWGDCDTSAFEKTDFFVRYDNLQYAMRAALKEPVATAAYGVAGCAVIDEFIAEATKSRDDLSLSGASFSIDGGEKRDCEAFRKLAAEHLKPAGEKAQ
ncbi:MAG: hypothetical protein R3E02_00200 [Blastomonas sp.]